MSGSEQCQWWPVKAQGVEAVVNGSHPLAEEFTMRGPRVNTTSPGPVWTDVWSRPGGPGKVLARRAGATLEDFTDQLPAAAGLSTGQSRPRKESRRWWRFSPLAGSPT